MNDLRNPRVAVLIDSSTTWGVEALKGIADYLRGHGAWSVFIEPRGWYEKLQLPAGWRGEGVIGRLNTKQLLDQVRGMKIPAVNVAYMSASGTGVAHVTTDELSIANMAADHLLGRGFRHFAYVGPLHYPRYQDVCGPAFAKKIKEAGFETEIYRLAHASKTSPGWQEQQARLSAWLKALPRPVGIYAWNNERGRQIIDVCVSAGLRVPDDVAVLGGDDDVPMNELSAVPLSGIDHVARRMGYAAAAALAGMMAGGKRPSPQLFQPLRVNVRRSTDVHAVTDTQVRTALNFIRDHAHEPIQVNDVLNAVPLSRRMLEQRFSRAMGRSPAAEITRVRLELCKNRLIDTDWTVGRIAEASGFNHPQVMMRLFQREVGISPGEFRRQARGESV